MKVNPQSFFNFCSGHVSLLRRLAEAEGEISEADARRLIRANLTPEDQLPETIWRRLKELQILVSTEPGSDFYFLAEPVGRLLAYLFDEAQAATPEMVRGCIESLAVSGKQLSRAIDTDDVAVLRLAMGGIQQTLRRVQSDLDETHRCIMAEVARYKTERRTVSVRDKFRRIVHWMERYVDPMVDIVRPDGPLRAAFDETERLLHRAREHGLFNDLPALERNFRHLRLLQRHALQVFRQCRRELQPLYESLRRSSFIAEGAALALERLQREGLDGWAEDRAITTWTLRWKKVPGDGAIERALRNVVEPPPRARACARALRGRGHTCRLSSPSLAGRPGRRVACQPAGAGPARLDGPALPPSGYGGHARWLHAAGVRPGAQRHLHRERAAQLPHRRWRSRGATRPTR